MLAGVYPLIVTFALTRTRGSNYEIVHIQGLQRQHLLDGGGDGGCLPDQADQAGGVGGRQRPADADVVGDRQRNTEQVAVSAEVRGRLRIVADDHQHLDQPEPHSGRSVATLRPSHPPRTPWAAKSHTSRSAPSSSRARVVPPRPLRTLDFLGSRQVGALEYGHCFTPVDARIFVTSNHPTAPLAASLFTLSSASPTDPFVKQDDQSPSNKAMLGRNSMYFNPLTDHQWAARWLRSTECARL